jgi:hypothetical protein
MPNIVELISKSYPSTVGLDNNNRIRFVCNFEATIAEDRGTAMADIGSLIVDAGIVSWGSSLFIGPRSDVTTNNDSSSVVVMTLTGGLNSLETANGYKYRRVSFQVMTYNNDYESCRTTMHAIYDLLDGLRGSQIA